VPPYTGPGYEPGLAVSAGVKAKGRTGKIIVGVVAAVLVLCCSGGVVALVAGGNDEQAARDAVTAQDDVNRAAALPSASTTSPAPSATSSSPTAAPTTTSAKPTKTTPPPVIISAGTYTVGEDMPAGRYKVVERAGEFCYWSISRNGELQDNHYGPGFPSFTVRNGDEVEVDGCPDYRKIK
jgi:hypothetical protein